MATTATTTSTAPPSTGTKIPTVRVPRKDGFRAVGSDRALGYNLPQRMGRLLWLPMFALALMGWGVGFALAVIEAATARSQVDDLQTLGHLVPAFMFVGFFGVFASISFAVARILGEFRRGGGEVQQTAGSEVQTLKMPLTAKIMLVFMMMGMMVMAAGVVVNVVAAGSFDGTGAADILDSARFGAAASGLRRLGVVLYLTGIAFGLGTIIEVLRFQSTRLAEVAASRGHAN